LALEDRFNSERPEIVVSLLFHDFDAGHIMGLGLSLGGGMDVFDVRHGADNVLRL
jgi:hypothetical protein